MTANPFKISIEESGSLLKALKAAYKFAREYNAVVGIDTYVEITNVVSTDKQAFKSLSRELTILPSVHLQEDFILMSPKVVYNFLQPNNFLQPAKGNIAIR